MTLASTPGTDGMTERQRHGAQGEPATNHVDVGHRNTVARSVMPYRLARPSEEAESIRDARELERERQAQEFEDFDHYRTFAYSERGCE